MWRKSWAHIWEHRIRFLFVSWHRGEEGKRESSLWASYAEKLRREPMPELQREAPQVSRKNFWRLREPRKGHEKLFGVCGSPASASKKFLVFAGTLRMPRKNFWDLQERCKFHEKIFGTCRNAANATKKILGLAATLHREPIYLNGRVLPVIQKGIGND